MPGHHRFGLDDTRLMQVIEICLAEEGPDSGYHQDFRQELFALLKKG